MTLNVALSQIQQIVQAELARLANRPGGLSTSGQSLKTHYEQTIRPLLQSAQTSE